MKYTDQKEHVFDPDLFSLADTQVALRLYDEYVKRASAKPFPKFMEVDRTNAPVDHLWHTFINKRTPFTPRSPIDVYTIVQFDKAGVFMGKTGLVRVQKFRFWLSHLNLKQLDYFPARGDAVAYLGYRLFITRCFPDPESYWQQTGVWTGVLAEAQVFPEGDASPLDDVSQVVPAEVSPAPPSKSRDDAVILSPRYPQPEL